MKVGSLLTQSSASLESCWSVVCVLLIDFSCILAEKFQQKYQYQAVCQRRIKSAILWQFASMKKVWLKLLNFLKLLYIVSALVRQPFSRL